MDFRTLEVFYSVATLKNFARAAESLRLTQSAVSQRIANLEAEVGGRLLERSNRGTSLTPKGHILLVYADRLLRTRMELTEAISHPDTTSRLIRIGVADTLAQTWLPAFIGSAHAQYPFITFEIDIDVTPNLRARLLRQEIDLAFLLGKVLEPGIASVDLCSYTLAFVSSPDITFDERPVSVEAMSKYALISFPKTTIPYQTIQELFRARSLGMPRIHLSSSISTIVRMTLDNIGISLIPPSVIKAELRDGRLALLDTDLPLPTLEYTASYSLSPQDKLLPVLARISSKAAQEWSYLPISNANHGG